ncbi:MAG TPA: GspH/FimT family protein, partial [Gemmataceae bacterium]|nr:GspH/FimT family protein [Gemmataceae bacterium]
IVAAVIVLLAAMAYPSIEAMYGDLRLTAAADQVRGRWAEARAKAIEEGRPYRFATQPDGQYKIAPDTSDNWSGSSDATASESNDADTPPLVIEESLPQGLKFADESTSNDNTDSGPWQTAIKFLPDGTASADKTIMIQADGYRPVQLRIRALTGAVTVETLAAGRSP